MESEVINAAATQGIFAILFVALFFYVIRTQDKREQKSEAREKRLIVALEKAQTNNQQLAIAVQKLADEVEEIKEYMPRRESA
ncbi:BhlA/UviB family holin-like peptide [Paenibacillus sp. J2TS4]|uniref:BhlA/UviB family holin-like peptide n=1 Tax=Paenibacillus sp. J2TS4 TaxID=2807194 RepID=UPI001B21B083|nr:BhlA/UviB family holin-like peptide [Paenibacillus sp. J2TS4]GIP35522.1 hypothetical protein J2TS4_47320 [Paenibacillus sp. J2TS4]